MELQVPHSPMLEIVVALPTMMGFSSPGSPWGDFSCKSQVFRSLCTAECKGEVSGFILMKNNGFGNSGDLGNSFLHLPALPGGWGSGNGGHHPGSGCCRWELGQVRHSLGAPESSGCSKGLQGLTGVWGSLRGPSCSEDPGGSKRLGLLLRATHELEGCSQESGVFLGVWGVPKRV